MSFSKKGLIEQLQYEGYTKAKPRLNMVPHLFLMKIPKSLDKKQKRQQTLVRRHRIRPKKQNRVSRQLQYPLAMKSPLY